MNFIDECEYKLTYLSFSFLSYYLHVINRRHQWKESFLIIPEATQVRGCTEKHLEGRWNLRWLVFRTHAKVIVLEAHFLLLLDIPLEE